MYALTQSPNAKPQPALVALAGPCPRRPWAAEGLSNLKTLAERRVR